MYFAYGGESVDRKEKKRGLQKIYPKTNREAERLKKSVDILRVLDYCGAETQKKGSAYFLRCPDQEHQDHPPYKSLGRKPTVSTVG